MNNFLKTDEYEEALSSLEMFAEILPTINNNTYKWKWSIIILHNSLQAFMVLSLRGTNGFLTMSKKSLNEWNEAYNSYQNPPVAKLDTFLGLFKKIKKYRGFQSTKECEFSIRKLHNLRNELIHFTPKSWHLEISGLLQISKHSLEITNFLINQGEITWYEEELYKRAIKSLENAETILTSLTRVKT